MGGGFSKFCSCFEPLNRTATTSQPDQQDGISAPTEPLDGTIGHSFRYVRSSSRLLSRGHSDRDVFPSNSLRFSPFHEPVIRVRPDFPETGFKAISGASVSANHSTPKTVVHLEDVCDGANDGTTPEGGVRGSIVNGFESTSSFSALPLQPAPRGEPHFLSGPIERSALSGPLEQNNATAEDESEVPFSAPLGGFYTKEKRKRAFSRLRKAFHPASSEKQQPGAVSVLDFVGRKEAPANEEKPEVKSESSHVQWALGKAGEDRVHVVVSEEHGWLFIGIYDGFNGPDAPEFLMCHLYRAVYNELKGLFWEAEGAKETNPSTSENTMIGVEELKTESEISVCVEDANPLIFQAEDRRRRLWEFLEDDDPEDGLDLSGSERFAFSVHDAINVRNAGSAVSRRWLLSKLKHGLSKPKRVHGGKLSSSIQYHQEKVGAEKEKSSGGGRKRKVGPVDADSVLRALSRALEATELAYLDMTDKLLDSNPELFLMGSCLLVVLMRDEDVYVMNVGDSRAIVAQYEPRELKSATELSYEGNNNESSTESVTEEFLAGDERAIKLENEDPGQEMRLVALQLSTDHSTSIEEEVIRIKNEHPDDSHCIVNNRVKGHLQVTRAFGAGFLKQPKWNDAVLETFRADYIGTAPYISSSPSLCHHRLSQRDQFLILSSDGLYQYLTNEEVVSQVENLMENCPDGDPAQHLIEQLLLRAAKKAGMDVHELLDIRQGDRRKYHDDVTVMVISLEGRIWKSSGKYL
ncbi:protein phosphatase 2C 29-like [Prosopis cineraria]|uniref:protein phosphatase 2C 29-like n=1 Tax=Prosopis cineraria TaxID=364024 RepID=UPI00240F915E|nr:protein phosphatase 2C 29-like [Prosopis cineraria]